MLHYYFWIFDIQDDTIVLQIKPSYFRTHHIYRQQGKLLMEDSVKSEKNILNWETSTKRVSNLNFRPTQDTKTDIPTEEQNNQRNILIKVAKKWIFFKRDKTVAIFF